MTEKQKHLLQLFREIDDICKRHGLRYVMAGGTLIGVLRNEGFIPWDDDVDIYMPRDDWDKFVELAKTELPPDRAVLSVEVDRKYTNSFPRYADTQSCAIHKHQVIGDDVAGEIIDVLTLDPIPADDKEYEKYRTHMMIYSELINISVVYGKRWEIPTFLYLRYLLSYVFLGKDRTLKKLEKILFSYREEDCDRYAMRWGGCPFLFDKDMMFPVKYGEFEGEKVMIPRRTNDYLVWHYGDEWSYIPPHGERESHEAICVDGISYQELRNDYMERIDKRKARFNAVVRKLCYLASAKKSHRLQHQRDLLQAKSTVLDLRARIRECGRSLAELVQQQEFEILNEIFCNYFQVQLSAGFIGREDFANIYPFYHPTLLEVEDEVFLAAMMTLFYTERISKAYRMLQVRESLDHVTPEMKKLMEDVVLFRKGTSHYEFGEKKEAEEITLDLLGRYPKNPSFLKMQCRLVMERFREEGHPGEAEQFLEEALELFPEDGYFLKYRGDFLWEKGRHLDALKLYADAREKTNNGIVHLELDKFLKPFREECFQTCRAFLGAKERQEALGLMELWIRLLPKDEQVYGYLCLARVHAAGSQETLETVMTDIQKKLTAELKKAGVQRQVQCTGIYGEALTRAYRRLGYAQELAELRTELICTQEEDELELLAEKIRSYKFRKDRQAEVYKLVGDVRRKQGRTPEAFESYFKALEAEPALYLKTEIGRIILDDLYRGSRRAAVYAKKGDAADFMDAWLGKYGGQEEICTLVAKLQ